MVASLKTIETADILLRHLGMEKALLVIGELGKVKGNKMFAEIVRLLYERLKLAGD
ncbi:MAG: hypothetical protein QGF23_03020 [Dehalococcoidales bacterium]|jgi:hypothetical protein|nr:hypothetical protein [Dehalococcoidales bacterium]|tara:strand:+ start:657 stop:824 length:168 start_codon:yes stop_codon:yes gene_type:complete